MRELTRNGVHLAYDDDGSGPPVLFSHCWFCDHRQWPQAEAVARAGYRVLNVDVRGHGRSGPYRARHSLWDVADDLIAVLDDAGEDRAVLVGHSIGGFASLRAALRCPERVRALVLAATMGGRQSRWDRVRGSILVPLLRTPIRPLLRPVLAATLFGATARRTQKGLVEEWCRRFDAQDARSMVAAFGAAILDRDDLTGRLGEIRQPTLVIEGEEDPDFRHAVAMTEAIPHARLVALPATGHLSSVEAPAAFEDALLAFVREVSPSPEPPATTATAERPDVPVR